MSNETGRSRFTRWRPQLADHCWFVWYEPTVTTATTAVTGPEAQPGAAPEAIGRRADAAGLACKFTLGERACTETGREA